MTMLRRGRRDTWSPYGHEKARRRLLMERQAYIVLGAVGIAILYGLFLQLTLTVETDVPTSGGSVDIRQDELRPITVTVTPGRAPAFMDGQTAPPGGVEPPRPDAEEQPFLIRTVGPFLPLVAPLLGALWLLSRAGASARGRLAELNFGVYKGAMPYEMHTARAMERVFTHREVRRHVFGKTATDFIAGSYLGPPPLAVRRLLGDLDIPDEASITRLARGRAPPAAKRRAPVHPSWKPTVVPQTAEVRRLRPRPIEGADRSARARAGWLGFLDSLDGLIERAADRLEPIARRTVRGKAQHGK
jgi:hypothetical protein